ncbi:MAG: TIGR00282 family metallophosphoesterase [Acutalibacteraceae bacterium]|nr:TIGR00282 family metallophosphoesterase [Clostridia bacterium]MEE3450914.1 TIGR00282 family metallophosphoesterase [Acutalibacteraceae bacterium]
MKTLCIGDVVGSNGCEFLMKKLPAFKRNNSIDFVIANGENSADGNGITPQSAKMLFNSGVDVITTGNHAFKRRECYDYFDDCNELVRPANYPEGGAPGRGYTIIDMLKYKVCVINAMGTFELEPLDCPFRKLDKILEETADCKIRILDFHAEATAEKKAMGYYLDGRISAVFGTHTHVQTADEAILPHGTGYITDVGMTGAVESVLGVKKEIIISSFIYKMPERFEIAEGECQMDCIIFDIDTKTGKAVAVSRQAIR